MKAASSLQFATLALAACTVGQELDSGTLHGDNGGLNPTQVPNLKVSDTRRAALT